MSGPLKCGHGLRLKATARSHGNRIGTKLSTTGSERSNAMDDQDQDYFRRLPPINPSAPQPSASKPQAGSPSPALQDSRPGPTEISDCVSCLMGQYRKDDAHDPEIYAASLGTLFLDYPPYVLQWAIDPRTGIATKHKWLPSISEVKE